MSFENASKALSLKSIEITSTFWRGRLDASRTGSLPAIFERMKETGRWECLKMGWKPGEPNKPHRFWDSDIAKWLEAACYSLMLHFDSLLASRVEEAVDMIRGAQHDDGYINTYYTVVEPGKQWSNISWSHEMYCAGHLLEAALAHHIYSQSMRLLGPMLRYVDYIASEFGIGKGQKLGYPGHQELELALLRVYSHLSATGPPFPFTTESKPSTDPAAVLRLANYLLEERGQPRPQGLYYAVEAAARGEPPSYGPMRRGGRAWEYMQADAPAREIACHTDGVQGHSVRAMYWLTALAQLARETPDESLAEAVARMWENVTQRKMYVTGGIGAMPEWEGFGENYFLPNETGYLETCASLGLLFFAHQLILSDPRAASPRNVQELVLHNAILAGVSLDGKAFFYENPLATIGGSLQRSKWFEVACCPPNVARTILSVGKYIYTVGTDDTIHVHLYISCTTEIVLANGRKVRIIQESNSPWQGGARFTIESEKKETLKWNFKKPNGAADFSVETDRTFAPSNDDKQSIILASTSETLLVNFNYPIRRIHPHPLNSSSHGCIAIARGPFIYCAEKTAKENAHISDLRGLRISDEATFSEEQSTIGGVEAVVLTGEVTEVGKDERVKVTLVPMFMWANRGRSDYRVWLPRLL